MLEDELARTQEQLTAAIKGLDPSLVNTFGYHPSLQSMATPQDIFQQNIRS